ncbi:MAG: hypothetical protein FJ137_22115, partial [Deltaproteobacteria bacterium]|nr:hypothetical protein [Deltaproteobacteria bacterium]
MNPRLLWWSALLSSSSALAVPSDVCVDSFSAGAQAFFQEGFVAGERAAVRLSLPPGAYPATVTGLRFLYGGADDGAAYQVVASVFDDNGDSIYAEEGFPGTALVSETHPVLSSTSDANEVLFDAPPTVVEGAFWIVIGMTNAGLPSVARDVGLTAGRGAVMVEGAGWVDNGDLGVAGDWIIRAMVEAPASVPGSCAFVGEGEGEGEGEG